MGEVGTGSGPTLEFYAQVADILKTSEPRLFRPGVPMGTLFPEPWDPAWLGRGDSVQASQILERFRLLGHVVAKCMLDGRLVDLQLHPLFWHACLGEGPLAERSLRDIDPTLWSSLEGLRVMNDEALAQLCVDFTLPGRPSVELLPGGAGIPVSRANLADYISKIAEASLVSAISPQTSAFRSAFSDVLPIEACRVWSKLELTNIVAGASVKDDACWTVDHLSAHIKAQHGYQADSQCFRDLLTVMAGFNEEDRRNFLAFATGAPALPIGGFAGLRPPLTVVKKEPPTAPLSLDQLLPSVMTCANYLKLPDYSSQAILKERLGLAMREGQSAFLLS